ncbi:hypothetical protein ACLESO_53930, partial [Pyxidicoccus sp. 3LG]
MKYLCITTDARHPVAEELRRQGQEVSVVANVAEAEGALTRGVVDVLVVEAGALAAGGPWLESLRAR